MRGFGKRSSIVGAAALAAAGLAAPAVAQASRTWVSGTGDNSAACTRAAPCLTFQRAHDLVAAGGEINCLTPGSFGVVVIEKSVTIDCTGVFGAALASASSSGVEIGGAGVNVVLRGLSISGGQSGNASIAGINFTSGESLTIDNVIVQNFGVTNGGSGILFQPDTAARLHVINALIANNGRLATGAGDGIGVRPRNAGYANVTLEDVRLIGNARAALGVQVLPGGASSTNVIANRSAFTSSRNGVEVSALAGTVGARVTLLRSIVTNNIVNGLLADGAAAQILASNTAIAGNSNGVLANGGSLGTYGNNELIGNGTNGAFNGFLTQN